MKAQERNYDVRLYVSGKYATRGHATVMSWEKSQRISRALFRAVCVLLIGFVVTLMPGLHLLGIALVLFGTPLFSILALKSKRKLNAGDGACPACGTELHFIPGAVTWPFYHCCPKCNQQVRVELARE